MWGCRVGSCISGVGCGGVRAFEGGVGRSGDITLSGINRNGAASPTAILHSCVSNSYGGGNELGEVREGTQVHKKPLARQSVRGACLRGWRVYLLM